MKKFGITYQLVSLANCGINFFFVIFHFSLVKATMKALHLCKLRKDCLAGIGHGKMALTKRLHFFIFQLPKAEHKTIALLPIAEGLSCEA
jgi:hypothetical protein